VAKESVPVHVENVTKRFKDTKGRADVIAVRQATFDIKPGELVTLLGPSGCGKTTTLRMIAGFELPSEGKIFIDRDDVTQLPPNKRDTATVFQSYGLFPHMNVFDNVAFGLKTRRMEAESIREKVMAMLELVGLQELAERSPARLSGGQQQRVALARSLIVEPSVLLLDEPLSNLDALLREQMRVEIRRIQKTLGITAVYVTHDRVEAMSLSDRIIVMKDGVIRQVGTPSQIYEDPDSKFVAGFVGKVAFFPVTVKSLPAGGGGSGGVGAGTSGGDVSGAAGGASAGARSGAGEGVVEFEGKPIQVRRWGPGLQPGAKAVLMARPESLELAPPGEGYLDGTVTTNVYLGSSVESYLNTAYGEIQAEIDNPAGKKIFTEGQPVSVRWNPALVKVLADNGSA
jgi:iron(III) transport system ATP-binding protein